MPFSKKIKGLFNQLLHSHATPEEVAWGFALGLFVGMTPTVGLHTVLALALAAIFRKNEISALIGAWVINPVTMFPVFYFNYKVGQWILPGARRLELKPESIRDVFHMGREMMLPLWAGGILVGLVAGIAGYLIVKKIYPYLKKIHIRKTGG